MGHQQFAAKIAYPCIFAKSVQDAANNLVRLITKQECGFDEGAARWATILEEYLQAPDELSELNRFGASFSVAEWCAILQQVRDSLIRARR